MTSPQMSFFCVVKVRVEKMLARRAASRTLLRARQLPMEKIWMSARWNGVVEQLVPVYSPVCSRK